MSGRPSIDINSDMGESFGAWRMGADEALMPHISSANIACGAHAGDATVMRRTVRLARDHGVTVVNSPGLVDSGYRGELRVTLLNTDASEAFRVEPGMRIAQLVVVSLPQIGVVLRDDLAASARGEQGFGSSGRV